MLNEILEFESYIKTPTSDNHRLQPKMLTDDFGSAGNLYGLEHILTTIARGFIFGNFYDTLFWKFVKIFPENIGCF